MSSVEQPARPRRRTVTAVDRSEQLHHPPRPAVMDHREYVRYIDERTAETRAKLWDSARHATRPAQILHYLSRLGYACTPSLGRALLYDEHPTQMKVYATSWLTGLRGVAAVKVLTFHYIMAFSDCGFRPWGTDSRHTHYLELPVVRLLYAGFTSQVFFGISGFLIATRVFQVLDRRHRGAQQDVFAVVSRDLFRKIFRLYLPVLVVTFCTAMYVWLGLYESYRALLLNHERLFPGDWYEPKPRQMALFKQIGYWTHEMFDLTNIVTENTVYPLHDQHLWAILAEMRGTLHLYGVLVTISQCRPIIRLAAMLVMSFLYFYWNHWEVWAFILGAMVAQTDLILGSPDQHRHHSPNRKDDDDDANDFELAPSAHFGQPSLQQWTQYGTTTAKDHRFQRILRYTLLFTALYFLSYPIDGARDHAPGYMLLNNFIPRFMVRKDKFYPNIGTAILLLVLARSDPGTSRLRAFLTHPICLYLGKIGFALFLVHGPVMHSIGYMLPHKLAWTFGTELQALGDFGWSMAIAFGWGVTLLLCLWAADVWQREVEGRWVEFTGWLQGWCFAAETRM